MVMIDMVSFTISLVLFENLTPPLQSTFDWCLKVLINQRVTHPLNELNVHLVRSWHYNLCIVEIVFTITGFLRRLGDIGWIFGHGSTYAALFHRYLFYYSWIWDKHTLLSCGSGVLYISYMNLRIQCFLRVGIIDCIRFGYTVLFTEIFLSVELPLETSLASIRIVD